MQAPHSLRDDCEAGGEGHIKCLACADLYWKRSKTFVCKHLKCAKTLQVMKPPSPESGLPSLSTADMRSQGCSHHARDCRTASMRFIRPSLRPWECEEEDTWIMKQRLARLLHRQLPSVSVLLMPREVFTHHSTGRMEIESVVETISPTAKVTCHAVPGLDAGSSRTCRNGEMMYTASFGLQLSPSATLHRGGWDSHVDARQCWTRKVPFKRSYAGIPQSSPSCFRGFSIRCLQSDPHLFLFECIVRRSESI